MRQTYFTPAVFRFLHELEDNNNRSWFEANKDRYIRTIREPAKEFILDFAPRLTAISDHYVADPRHNGGSLKRPYRDARRARNKDPYKTHVGFEFRHEMARHLEAPSFSLYLEPGNCWAGVGLFMPDAKVAKRIRDRIHEDPAAWRAATQTKEFLATWDATPGDNEVLKRVPKEYEDPEFPLDVRRKSFVVSTKITQKTVTSASFDDDLAKLYEMAAGLNRFLCHAIGLPF